MRTGWCPPHLSAHGNLVRRTTARMVVLGARDTVVRPAKLWNDTESAPDARELVEALPGGAGGGRQRVGAYPSPASPSPSSDGYAAASRKRFARCLGGSPPRLADLAPDRAANHRSRRRIRHGLLVPGRGRGTASICWHWLTTTLTGIRASNGARPERGGRRMGTHGRPGGPWYRRQHGERSVVGFAAW